MGLETNGIIEELQARWGGQTGLTEGAQDLSGGVAEEVGNVTAFTLYLKVTEATAVDVTVELSPDGGETWYVPDESPVSIASDAEDAVEHIPYNADAVRLEANNATPVQAQFREVV